MGSGETVNLGRKRQDSIHGIVLMDQNGDDRLYLGRETKLQMGGKLVERHSMGWSLSINEPGEMKGLDLGLGMRIMLLVLAWIMEAKMA
ncbi:hypothetical protein ABTW24_19435 [Sphingobacterium thalpophilum]|uniref:Uncharacterized protein n=1 Tax=Sphingobacterium thalpophilum TaxID=259 RepID=A0ABV4HH48_9SPHI